MRLDQRPFVPLEPAVRRQQAERKTLYRGRTLAYRRFRRSEQRTRSLLEAGLLGLGETGRKLEELTAKFVDFKMPRGRRRKDYEPTVVGKRTSDGVIEMTMDERSAYALRKIMGFAVAEHKGLRFHYYSILAVYVWGTYETYLTMLFEELYTKRPQLLISNETLTYRDVVEKREALIGYLIEQQLDRLGRMSLPESTKYLADRINFVLDGTAQKQLAGFYLVRNIIAHNTGMLRPSQVKNLPKGTSSEESELRVTKAFLARLLDRVDRVVTSIERHVETRFYQHREAATDGAV